jgi:hypothetical protein
MILPFPFFFLLLFPQGTPAYLWAPRVSTQLLLQLAAGVATLKSRSCLRNKLILIHAEKTRITGWSRRILAKLLIRMAWQVSYSCVSLIKSRDCEGRWSEERAGRPLKDEMEIECRENRETNMINSKIEQLPPQCALLLEIYCRISLIYRRSLFLHLSFHIYAPVSFVRRYLLIWDSLLR